MSKEIAKTFANAVTKTTYDAVRVSISSHLEDGNKTNRWLGKRIGRNEGNVRKALAGLTKDVGPVFRLFAVSSVCLKPIGIPPPDLLKALGVRDVVAKLSGKPWTLFEFYALLRIHGAKFADLAQEPEGKQTSRETIGEELRRDSEKLGCQPSPWVGNLKDSVTWMQKSRIAHGGHLREATALALDGAEPLPKDFDRLADALIESSGLAQKLVAAEQERMKVVSKRSNFWADDFDGEWSIGRLTRQIVAALIIAAFSGGLGWVAAPWKVKPERIVELKQPNGERSASLTSKGPLKPDLVLHYELPDGYHKYSWVVGMQEGQGKVEWVEPNNPKNADIRLSVDQTGRPSKIVVERVLAVRDVE